MAGEPHGGYHIRMARASRRSTVLGIVSFAACLMSCTKVRDPIVVRDGMLVLENQTTREWRDVRVTINDHFNGGVRVLLPGGLMNAPLRDFETGFGQRFDRGRMSVFKVRVSATDSAGQPVALAWGK
jgi:hypothetical protein